MHPRTNILVALVAMVTAGSMFAGDSKVLVIKGKVIGDEGKPTDGTEVRVKALDRQGPDKVVETNSQGQYIVVGLVPGDYSVTAYDSFGNARSRAMIKTNRRGWASVNFNLALDSIVGDGGNTITGHDHMWSASSHLGNVPIRR